MYLVFMELEVRGWKLEVERVGRWRSEAGDWKLEAGGGRLEVENCRLMPAIILHSIPGGL